MNDVISSCIICHCLFLNVHYCHCSVRDLGFQHLDIMEYFAMEQSKCQINICYVFAINYSKLLRNKFFLWPPTWYYDIRPCTNSISQPNVDTPPPPSPICHPICNSLVYLLSTQTTLILGNCLTVLVIQKIKASLYSIPPSKYTVPFPSPLLLEISAVAARVFFNFFLYDYVPLSHIIINDMCLPFYLLFTLCIFFNKVRLLVFVTKGDSDVWKTCCTGCRLKFIKRHFFLHCYACATWL